MNQTTEQKRIAAAERLGISPTQLPRHIAIVMDGNGRWATNRGLPRFEGHREGGKRVESVVLDCVDMGIECLTLYSFSLQNWKRPQMEVDFLMQLYTRYLVEIRKMLMDNDVRLAHFGRTDGLPELLLEEFNRTLEMTSNNKGLVLGLALNYGGREEIIDAAKKIAADCVAGRISPDQIDEQMISENLYSANLPDPDLIIRTSNELRISNFLLWQISYAEFYPTDTLWPDFSVKDLEDAIMTFASRSRRMGDVKPQPLDE